MADSALNQFLSRGTTAERIAFVPDPPTPSAGPDPGYVWWDTDTQTEWAYDFGLADWVEMAGGAGGGGVAIAAGTQTATTSTVVFSNSNGITFGMSGSTRITASHNGLTTAMASNAASDFVAATAAFAGTNASGTINSTGISVSVGNYITTARASTDAVGLATAQTNVTWTVNSAGISLNAGGYAGTGFTSTTTAGTAIVGTLSNNGLSLGVPAYLTAAAGGGGSNTAGMSNLGNTSGTTGVVSGSAIQLLFAGGNNITLSQSINGSSATITISGANVGGAQTGISALSAGTTSITSGTVSFSDASGVSWGINGNTITASVKTDYLTTAGLSGDTSKYIQAWQLTGNTAGTTSSLQGTKIHFSGGNSITVSGSSNTVVFSVGNYLTTARASTDAVGLATAQTNVTWTVNSAGISLNASGYAGTATAITGGSLTVNSGGVSINLPAYLTTAMQSNAVTLSNIRVSAGTTSNLLSALTFSDGSGVTWGLNASTITASVKTDYLTTAMASNNGSNFVQATAVFNGTNASGTIASGAISVSVAAQTNQTAGLYAVGNTTGQSSSSTFDARTFSISGAGNVSVGYSASQLIISGGSAAPSPVNFSAGTTSGNLGSVVFSNSNGVSFGLNGSTVTATVSTYSTVGTATSGYPVASANSIGTVTRWAAEDHRHAGIGGIGISTEGNEVGTTGSQVGTYWLQGGNNITLSQITSNNGSHTLIVSGASPYVGYLEPFPMTNTQNLGPGAGTWYFAPFVAPGVMSGGRINFLQSNTSTAGLVRDITGGSYVSQSSGGKNQSYTYSRAVALYSQGTGSNSTRLESFWSNSFSFGLSHRVLVDRSGAASNVSVSVSQSISYISEIGSDGAYTFAQFASASNSNGTNTSMASAALDSVGLSIRNMLSDHIIVPIGFNTTIQPGAYWLAAAWSTTTASATSQTSFAGASALMFSQIGWIGISRLLLEASYRNWASTATTSRSHIMPYGAYTGAANMAPPQFVAFSSDLASVGSAYVPYFNFQLQGITK